jgi:hypothetical protein
MIWQDVSELIDTLQRIAAKFSHVQQQQQQQSEDDDDHQDEDEDEDDVDDTQAVAEEVAEEVEEHVAVSGGAEGEVIRSWSELVRQVAAHVTVERSFSSDEVLLLLTALINQEELFVGMSTVLDSAHRNHFGR